MVQYSKVNRKLTNMQLKKLKTAIENKTGTTLRMSLKMFDRNGQPHKFWLTTTQKTKFKNVLENKMSIDIKFSKAQIFKIIPSGWFLGSLLSKLADPLMKPAVTLAKIF